MSEIELRIHIYGEKSLRKKSSRVRKVGKQERDLLKKMAEVMYSSGGIGLAAPQVGINRQMIVVDVGQGLCQLINPKVLKKDGSLIMQEGCLSLPEVCVNIKRAKKVFIEYTDENNKKISFWADNLFSRAVQHEIDHLKGKLIVDYVNLLKRMSIRKRFKKQLKKGIK
ncbi:peptide deformylase [Thermoproteota archaeon]